MVDRDEAKRKFDDFLMIFDDQIEALEKDAASRGVELDMSMNSLAKLEQLFSMMAQGADKSAMERLMVYFARYLGEIVRKNYGGKWHLSLEDPKDVNFNTPVIVGHSPIQGLEFAPIAVMRAYALKRRSGTLSAAIDAQVNPKPLDLSDLVEER